MAPNQDDEPGAGAPSERGAARRQGRRPLQLPYQQVKAAGRVVFTPVGHENNETTAEIYGSVPASTLPQQQGTPSGRQGSS